MIILIFVLWLIKSNTNIDEIKSVIYDIFSYSKKISKIELHRCGSV